MRRLRYGVLVAVSALVGCADPGSVGNGQVTTTAIATSTSQPGELTLQGMVRAGVEPGCLLLDAGDGQQYLLLGGDEQVVRVGAKVEVRGRPRPDLLTTCQQGVPFQVVEATEVSVS